MYKTETTYYPQSEIFTTLIPVTTGCPHNKCAFCAMFKENNYSEVEHSDIEFELMNADEYTEKVFLTGADPLAIGYEKMLKILKLVKKHLPYCACVAAYATVRSIAKYSVEELKVLHEMGLRLLYIGFESGSDDVLEMIHKGHTAAQAVEQGKKLNEAKIMFNSIVMYAVAGHGKGEENAKATAAMLNQFHSNKIVTMNLTIFESTELSEKVKRGEFVTAGVKERYAEVKTLLEHLEPEKTTIFDTTHATNIIKMEGRLPADKEKLLARF